MKLSPPTMSRPAFRPVWLLAVLGCVLGGAIWLGTAFSASPPEFFQVAATADVTRLKEYLLSFGLWAPAISALLMILQAVPLPLPTVMITVTNGLLFGAFWGTLLSWSSAMVAAAISWAIGRGVGRPATERMIGTQVMRTADAFFERYGNRSVLIARLIPVISFRAVSYAAGIGAVEFTGFMVATGIGQLPATIVYSALGENLPRIASLGLSALGIAAGVVALLWAIQKLLQRRVARDLESLRPETPTDRHE